MGKKQKNLLIIIITVILISLMVLLISDKEDNEKDTQKTEKIKIDTDINSKLPYTLQVYERDKKPEIIAYRIFFDLMKTLEGDGTIDDASFLRFTRLSGDADEFVVAVVFHVQLPEGSQETDYNWGGVRKNRSICDIVWKLTIQRKENLTYTITNIEKSSDKFIGLPPVESMEDYRKEAGIEEPSESIDYELKDDTLRITYTNGQSWQVVPVAIDDLFGVENNGDLNDGSYIITRERTAFLLGDNGNLRILLSKDKGKSWDEVSVSDQLPALRIGLLGFTSEQYGYIIATGDKTMSSEMNFIFKTNDGGKSWRNAGSVDDTNRLVTDGAFINDKLGFISFGEYRLQGQPPSPNLYRTADGGENWERVDITIPEKFQGYFTIAEIPTFNGTEGILLVNQGSQGDYLGGKVLAKFTSQDKGETWSFAGLVDPDGVLSK